MKIRKLLIITNYSFIIYMGFVQKLNVLLIRTSFLSYEVIMSFDVQDEKKTFGVRIRCFCFGRSTIPLFCDMKISTFYLILMLSHAEETGNHSLRNASCVTNFW